MTALDVLVFYVPVEDTDEVLDALFEVGAGHIGNYDRGAFVVAGRGQFRPLEGADPTLGQVGEVEYVKENRVELVFPRDQKQVVVNALRDAHPYEEPAFHVLENAAEQPAARRP